MNKIKQTSISLVVILDLALVLVFFTNAVFSSDLSPSTPKDFTRGNFKTMKIIDSEQQKLFMNFNKKFAQIEVGGPFAGLEFHKGAVLPNRISFFYPLANTIDASGDYWHRDRSRIFFLGLKIGNKPWDLIEKQRFDYSLSPYSVAFKTTDEDKIISISYQFCQNKPAMVLKIELKNNQKESIPVEIFTCLNISLRTSSTYELKEKAWTEFEPDGSTIYVNFENPETSNAQVFVANAGELPVNFTTVAGKACIPGISEDWRKDKTLTLSGEIINKSNLAKPAAAYLYKKTLAPNTAMTIVQVIGSCRQTEGREIIDYLLKGYSREINLYENFVKNKALYESILNTGDEILDRSIPWAKAILAVNAHYLNEKIVPMPCPAEYNFFFTHDTLLTDLAAIFFDKERVKKDLEFILERANKEGVIPHAYYWKDKEYYTEYVGPDGWNNQWFVIVSGRYLRHTNDRKTLEKLYPSICTSVKQFLKNKKDDDLIWAYRPDWWDIGSNFGPRTYMTILSIQALKDYIYISTVLAKDSVQILQYEALASKMQAALNEKLWDKDLKYLINYYENGNKDAHIYIGSLLSIHFDMLYKENIKELLNTAEKMLLDDKLGIYNVAPMDFHKLIKFMKCAGNEAGDRFLYLNGGIWPHGNAWFALALLAIEEKEKALNFVKKIMTLDGIMDSPGGQPSMCEYRCGDTSDLSKYGVIDKPQFLWAAGWYLYCCYHLLGVRENTWNISLNPFNFGTVPPQFDLLLNDKLFPVKISGKGKYVKSIKYNEKLYPSLVIPVKPPGEKIEITLGIPDAPYLLFSDSILNEIKWIKESRQLLIILHSFQGHQTNVTIISPFKAKSVLINKKEYKAMIEQQDKRIYRISFAFQQHNNNDTVRVNF